MSAHWYYTKDNKTDGPITYDDLRIMAQNALLGPEDMVWQDSLPNPTPARLVWGLFPKTPTLPPAFLADTNAQPPSGKPPGRP